MMKYRYALSLTSQFYFCGLPFRFDAAPNCTFHCLYCFSQSRGGNRTALRSIARSESIKRKLLLSLSDLGRPLDVNGEMLRHRVPIHMGGISDPFSNDTATQASKDVVALLCDYDYPVVISTKNAIELMRSDTLELLKRNSRVVVQMSFTTPTDRLAKLIEPRAPAPDVRFECLSVLTGEGVRVQVRVQPLLLPWLKETENELIPRLSQVNCEHVMVEFLKLPVEKNTSSVHSMLDAIRWDAYAAYKENHASLMGREWVLPPRYKWERLQPVIDAIHRYGMTYGAADLGLTHMGDTACCCGIDIVPGFEGWFKGNLSNVLRNAAKDYISFNDVRRYWTPPGSVGMYINSRSRLGAGQTVLDYLRAKWNRPGTTNAPDTYLGVSWAGRFDEDRNAVYVKGDPL